MDFLSGVRFPPPMGTLATTAFITAHIRCDPSFYAPFCGTFIGFWTGNQGINYARDFCNRRFSSFSQNLEPVHNL